MRPRNWIVLGLLSFFAFVPIAGCQAEPYPKPEPVVSNSPFDESRLFEFKRSCDSQISAFDERLDLVDTRVDKLDSRVTQLEMAAVAKSSPPIDPAKLDPESYEIPKIKPDSPVAKGKTYETEVLGWLKSPDPTTNSTASNCPDGKCPLVAQPVKSQQTVAAVGPDDRPGHWTYPGTIDSHLKETHGVDPSGLTREQKLTLHDQLHEGTASTPVYSAPAPVYQSVATRSTCPRGGCPPAQKTYQVRGRFFRR